MRKRNLESLFTLKFLIIVIFLSAFIIGMLLALAGINRNESVDWPDTLLIYLKYGEIYYGDMVFYVLKKRIAVIVFLVILCMSGKGKYFLLGGVGVYGAFVGFYITEFIIIKGILGSLFFAVCIFPHYLFYAYGYYKALLYLDHKNITRESINQLGQNTKALFYVKSAKTAKLLVPFVVVIIGIMLECYVNPFLVKIFLKIFM